MVLNNYYTPVQRFGQTKRKRRGVKKVNKSTAKPGDVVTYTLTVKNVGDGDAENVVVTDTLPKNLSYAAFTGRSHSWSLGNMKPGKSVIIEYDVRVESDAKRGTYKNVAVVKADNTTPKEKEATAKIEVRVPSVLGAELPVTGAGPLDLLTFLSGGALAGFGALGLRKRGQVKDQPTNFLNLE